MRKYGEMFAKFAIRKNVALVLAFVLALFGQIVAPVQQAKAAMVLDGSTATFAFNYTKVTSTGAAMINDFTDSKYAPVSSTTATGIADGDIIRYNTVSTIGGFKIDVAVKTSFNCGSKPISAISGNGTSVTYTTAAAHNYTPGMRVNVTGSNIAGYNVTTGVISATTTNTFTIANTTTGVYTSGANVATTACASYAGTPVAFDSSAAPIDYQISTATNATNSGVSLSFSFYLHGTYTGPGTGTSVTLTNVPVYVEDLDVSSAGNNQFQFAEFSGFQKYLMPQRDATPAAGCSTDTSVQSATRCDSSLINVNQVQGTNLVRFLTTHNANGSNDPTDRAYVVYDSISDVTIKTGNVGLTTGSTGSIFSINFGAPPTALKWYKAGTSGTDNGPYQYTTTYNTPPEITGTVPTKNVQTGIATPFYLNDFGNYYDFDNNPFNKIKIVTLPSAGTLQYLTGGSWTNVTAGQDISVSAINNGNLRFLGTATTSFTFKPNDALAYSNVAYTLPINIDPRGQTITFANPGSKTPSAGTFSSGATATSGLTVVLTSNTPGVCTVNGTSITVVGSGICEITATQPGDGTYAAAPPVTQAFSVTNLTAQTINFVNPGDKTVSTTAFASGATATSGLTVTLGTSTPTICSVSGLNITAIAIGTCVVQASQAGDATYAAAASVTQVFNVVGSSYTLTYNGNTNSGGTAPSSVSSASGFVVGGAGSLVKTGYNFTGWNTLANGQGTAYASGDSISSGSNVTLYAQWTAVTYTLSFDTGTGGTFINPQTLQAGGDLGGTIVNAATPTRSGYVFVGWKIGTATVTGNETMPASNVTATAVWDTLYTLTYNANGGSTAPNSETQAGAFVAAAKGSMVKSGYHFTGWNTQANGSGTAYAAGSTVPTGANLTLYAQWALDTFELVYNANGGTNAPATQTVASTPAAAGTSMVYLGHTFVKWNTQANGQGTDYAAGATVSLTANLELFAQWTLTPYTVTFETGGGSAVNPLTINYHGTLGSQVLGVTHPTRSGYEFVEWQIDNTAVPSGLLMPANNVTATAVWNRIYSISYNANNGTGTPPATVTSSGTFTVAGQGSLARSGWDFDGWNTVADESGTFYAAGETIPATSDVTLYAVWSQAPHTISYNANGGSNPPASVTQHGEFTAAAKGIMARAGYRFLGWNSLSNGNGIDYAPGDSVPSFSNVTLYAKWELITYTLTYDANGGDNPPTAGIAPGTYTAAPAGLMARYGYTFNGWNTEANGSGTRYAAGASIPGGVDKTVYAIWVINSHHVTYATGTGATVIPQASVDYQGALGTTVLAHHPTRTGYVFTGWTIDGLDVASGDLMPDADVTATAHWLQEFTLTYNANGGSGAPGTDVETGDFTAASANSMHRIGYTFSGWWNTQTNGLGTSYDVGATVPGGSNRVLYAHWTINSHQLNFVTGNGGTVIPSVTMNYHGSLGVEVRETALPTRAGFDFVEWQIDGTKVLDSTLMPDMDATVTAVWAEQFTLTYNANGGQNAPAAEVRSGHFYTSDKLEMSKTGYSFTGWNTEANGSGTAYGVGVSIVAGGNITLYAQWSINHHHVDFATGNGASTIAAITLPYEGSLGVRVLGVTHPTRPGYDFVAWEVNGTRVTDADLMPDADVTALAIWIQRFTITYHANGGASAPAAVTKSGEFSAAAKGGMHRTGYGFTGWNTLANGTGTTYATGDTIPATENIDLYAQWSNQQHTLTYNANAGSGAPDALYTADEYTVADPGGMNRLGWNFVSWNSASDGSGDNYQPGAHITNTGDLTLYAIWSNAQHTLTYLANGGSGAPAAVTQVANWSAASGSGLTRSGYTFSGWSAYSDGHGTVYHPNDVVENTNDMTLYAIWTPAIHNLRFNTGGGTLIPAQVLSFGELLGTRVLAVNNPTRFGYRFTGWQINSADVQVTDTMPDADVIATALWLQLSPQAITFAPIGSQSLSTGSIRIAPTASSGLTVSITGLSPNVCSVRGGVVVFLSEGVCSIATAQIGNQEFSAAVAVNRSFRIFTIGTSTLPQATVGKNYSQTLAPLFGTNGTWKVTGLPAGLTVDPNTGEISGNPGKAGSYPLTVTYTENGQTYTVNLAIEVVAANDPTANIPNVVSDPGSGLTRVLVTTPNVPVSDKSKTTVAAAANENLSGFNSGEGIEVNVIGAKTVASLVVPSSGHIDVTSFVKAIQQQQAGDGFASVDSAQAVTSGNTSGITLKSITPEDLGYFSSSGLNTPRLLSSLNTANSTNWVNFKISVKTYRPGSTVYLAMTSVPTIFATAVVDKDGNAKLVGDMALDVLPAGVHKLRVVGDREVGKVSVDNKGQVKLSQAVISEIQKFDQGTHATVIVRDSSNNTSIRVIPLDVYVPWWLLLVLALLGLILLVLRYLGKWESAIARIVKRSALGLAGAIILIVGLFVESSAFLLWTAVLAAVLLSGTWLVPNRQKRSRH